MPNNSHGAKCTKQVNRQKCETFGASGPTVKHTTSDLFLVFFLLLLQSVLRLLFALCVVYFESLAPDFYLCTFFIFLWLGYNIAVLLHLLTKPQKRNGTEALDS